MVRDIPLIFGLLAAFSLTYFSFMDKAIFWYLYTASLLFLVSIAIKFESFGNRGTLLASIWNGSWSGLLLYGIFWIGYQSIIFFELPFLDQVRALYEDLSPSLPWHFLVLHIIVIPGEELFWRGFVLKRFLAYLRPSLAVLLGAFAYALPLFISANSLLFLAGIVGGLTWGFLYVWKRNMLLIIISHIVFDLVLLVILPFH